MDLHGSSAALYAIAMSIMIFLAMTVILMLFLTGNRIWRGTNQNFSNFLSTNNSEIVIPKASQGFNTSFNTSVIQGIIGVSYFMDDFTWAGMDLRYTTTKSLPQMQDFASRDKPYALTSLNFNINFAFDKGAWCA